MLVGRDSRKSGTSLRSDWGFGAIWGARPIGGPSRRLGVVTHETFESSYDRTSSAAARRRLWPIPPKSAGEPASSVYGFGLSGASPSTLGFSVYQLRDRSK
jgi:hypothetical protein